MIFFDSHCDSPSQMLRLRDFSIDNEWGQVDFPKMVKGGVGASFFALYIPASLQGNAAFSYAEKLMAELLRQLDANQDKVALACNSAEVKVNHDKGLISIMIGMENGSPIMDSAESVKDWFARGVRYITLTHSADNQICDSCTGKGVWNGLSPFGREVISVMNETGMIIDLAHSSEKTMLDVLEISKSPVFYTHGCCRSLASHRRNISDKVMKKIADSGGVVGISIYPCFLSDVFCKILENSGLENKMYIEDEFIKNPSNPSAVAAWRSLLGELEALPRPSIEKVVDHIEHAVNVAGIDHVGIGTDYDGIEVTPIGLEDISGMPILLDALKKRGFSNSDVDKIAGNNFLSAIVLIMSDSLSSFPDKKSSIIFSSQDATSSKSMSLK